jgi:hypothetical protein
MERKDMSVRSAASSLILVAVLALVLAPCRKVEVEPKPTSSALAVTYYYIPQ